MVGYYFGSFPRPSVSIRAVHFKGIKKRVATFLMQKGIVQDESISSKDSGRANFLSRRDTVSVCLRRIRIDHALNGGEKKERRDLVAVES